MLRPIHTQFLLIFTKYFMHFKGLGAGSLSENRSDPRMLQLQAFHESYGPWNLHELQQYLA